MHAPARFALIAASCLGLSGRRGRRLLPNAAPRLELHGWQLGTRLASVLGPPKTAGMG